MQLSRTGLAIFRLTYIIWKYWTVGTIRSPTRPVSLFRWEGLQYFVLFTLYYLLTYLLTHSIMKVLLEKLTGLQLVKKFLAFYGTQRFITTLTSVRHPSLSLASPIQSTYPHPTSWTSNYNPLLLLCPLCPTWPIAHPLHIIDTSLIPLLLP